MSRSYAKGSRAWGLCQRSGERHLLKDLIPDGRFPHLLVHPTWWEPKHPQEIIVDVIDPVALAHPSPDQNPDPNHGVEAPDISTLVPIP